MKSYPYSESEKAVRLAFCNYILKQKDEFFDTIFFTDESSLQLGMLANRIYVRRPKGEVWHFADTYTWKDESKKRSGTIKFFGGFSSKGVGKLHYCVKMNGAAMNDVVKNNIIPEMRRLFPSGPAYILHDNDKRWRCHEVEDFVHKKGITQLNDSIWPSHSPDLNPIENLWADVASRVFDRNPCGVNELREFLEEEWTATPPELLRKLAHSMKKRCQDCLDQGGTRTKY